MNRPDKDTYYLDIAKAVSQRSTCLKRRYGCVIVKDDVIVSTGYNGSPRGYYNCCDTGKCQRKDSARYQGYENCPAVHAEQNALLQVDRAHSQGATLYLVCEDIIMGIEDLDPLPCGICQNMIRNAGINRVVTRAREVHVDGTYRRY